MVKIFTKFFERGRCLKWLYVQIYQTSNAIKYKDIKTQILYQGENSYHLAGKQKLWYPVIQDGRKRRQSKEMGG